jgi:hypothetical protein
LQRLKQRLKDVIEYYYDDDYQFLADVVTVPLRTLEAIDDDEEASALATARVLTTIINVADCAEVELLPPGRPSTETFEAEEMAWQASALDVAERHGGPANRAMFASISPAGGPQWLRRFLAAQKP